MGSTLITGGVYTVELDTGEIEDGFTLGDATRGVLGSTEYVLTGTTTFTDVSDLATTVRIFRGRRRPIDQFPAGTISVLLRDNANRDLDPYNEDSAFFNVSADMPGLSPLRKIRVSRNGTYIFQGRVAGYDYEYAEQNFATISGYDDLYLLAQTTLSAFTPSEETSTDRITAILDRPEVGFGANRDLTSTPVTTLGAYAISAGTNTLAYLQSVALKAEQGRLFMRAADNDLVFENRLGNTISAPSVAFDDVGVGVRYTKVDISYDSDIVVNSTAITRTGGTVQTATDPTSIATYFIQEYDDTNNLVSDDTQAATLATYLLNPDPEPRFTGLTAYFGAISDQNDQDDVAFLEIGETVTITRTFTTGTPAAITEELAIEGIEHTIETARGHTVRIYTSPTEVVYTFILGDAVFGLLGIQDLQPVLT
jgi:hypothetical protein